MTFITITFKSNDTFPNSTQYNDTKKKTLSVMTIVLMVQQNDTKNDPTVWLDGGGPANPCISPSFLRNMTVQLCGIPTPKNK